MRDFTVSLGEGKMMTEHKYFCPMRPPQLGAVPKEGLLYVESFKAQKYVRCIGRLAWGYAVYSRPLTAGEVADYELIAEPEAGAMHGG